MNKTYEIKLQTILAKMGAPSEDQLAKICAFTGRTWLADEWFVCCWNASNTLVSRSPRAWHGNILEQMKTSLLGRPLILDHDWEESEESVGFIFDTEIAPTPDKDIDCHAPTNALNRDMMSWASPISLYCWTAIKTDLDQVVGAIQSRRFNDCSTGGLIPLRSVRMLCPICSKEAGREVGFADTNAVNEFLCKHDNPMAWDADPDVAAPYAIVDGVFDGVELSICVCGQLPAASIVR